MLSKTDADIPLLALYERMLLIRRIEEGLARDVQAGRLPGPVHLYIGQEAIAVGVCAQLAERDLITSTHRGHGHFLAKGGDPGAMIAEVWGKDSGICRGMGGSMHVADLSKGILGANGIVGGGLGIATGAAFAAKLDGGQQVVVAFFGDGAANQGVLVECLNISSLWELPVIFVCENNLYGEMTPSKDVTAGKILDRPRACDVRAVTVDGNDVEAVYRASREAIEQARAGNGPSFMEALTYRVGGHFEAEAAILGKRLYRSEAEVAQWREADPLARLRVRLLETRYNSADLEQVEDRVRLRVAEAVAYAEAGEPADSSLALHLMSAGATGGEA